MSRDITADSPVGLKILALIEATDAEEARLSEKRVTERAWEDARNELRRLQNSGGFGMGANSRERFVSHARSCYRLSWSPDASNGSVYIEAVQLDELEEK